MNCALRAAHTHRLQALGLALFASDGIAGIHAVHLVVDQWLLGQCVAYLRGEKDTAGAGHGLIVRGLSWSNCCCCCHWRRWRWQCVVQTGWRCAVDGGGDCIACTAAAAWLHVEVHIGSCALNCARRGGEGGDGRRESGAAAAARGDSLAAAC